jgi:hypothetical protein
LILTGSELATDVILTSNSLELKEPNKTKRASFYFRAANTSLHVIEPFPSVGQHTEIISPLEKKEEK